MTSGGHGPTPRSWAATGDRHARVVGSNVWLTHSVDPFTVVSLESLRFFRVRTPGLGAIYHIGADCGLSLFSVLAASFWGETDKARAGRPAASHFPGDGMRRLVGRRGGWQRTAGRSPGAWSDAGRGCDWARATLATAFGEGDAGECDGRRRLVWARAWTISCAPGLLPTGFVSGAAEMRLRTPATGRVETRLTATPFAWELGYRA